MVGAITFDKEATIRAVNERVDAKFAPQREELRAQGVTDEQFEAAKEQGKAFGRDVVDWMPTMFGGMGAVFTAGGAALIYSGYNGLTEEEPVRA